jgi:hypothetical protein
MIRIHNSLKDQTFWISHLVSNLPIKNLNDLQTAFFQQKILENWVFNVLLKIFSMEDVKDQRFISLNTLKNEKEIAIFLRKYFDSEIYDPTLIIISLCYMHSIWDRKNKILQEFKIMFGICIILSMKMNEDICYTNRAIYNELGFYHEDISLAEFNSLEMQVLNSLNFDILLSLDELIDFIEFYAGSLTVKIINEITKRSVDIFKAN